jgi:GNAT superfamily N-acetyltransferase
VVAVANSENPDEQAFLHVHPSHRDLESELLEWAETNIATVKAGRDRAELVVWAIDGDTIREQLLRDRGHVRQDLQEFLLLRDLDHDPPSTPLPKGYTIHTVLDPVDLDEKISCMSSAFQSEPYPREIYETMQSAPSYHPEFDLFTRDVNGAISSFCIIWVDDELDVAYFEPVGTDPDHQRRGLGTATLNEGLLRLRSFGVKKAYVGASGDWRGAFYGAAGFHAGVAFRPWRKRL